MVILCCKMRQAPKRARSNGFTLIEVLLALAIIAIAFTALLKATSQDISGASRIKDKTISHWVATQGITLIQLGLLNSPNNQELSEVTTLFNQDWYWRASIKPTAIESVQQITVTVSKNQSGPFGDPVIAYRYITS